MAAALLACCAIAGLLNPAPVAGAASLEPVTTEETT
jgi:hypothetical protein